MHKQNLVLGTKFSRKRVAMLILFTNVKRILKNPHIPQTSFTIYKKVYNHTSQVSPQKT